MNTIPKITPNLWFERNAEEAAEFYITVFPDSRISRVSHYSEEGFDVHGMSAGTVMTVEFYLAGQRFLALNGGPHFKFNEAISLMIDCQDQAEIDRYWDTLSANGDPDSQQCGWLKDRFGLSWQVTPAALGEMMVDPDQNRRDRVMRAMLQMKKLDIAVLQHAYAEE